MSNKQVQLSFSSRYLGPEIDMKASDFRRPVQFMYKPVPSRMPDMRTWLMDAWKPGGWWQCLPAEVWGKTYMFAEWEYLAARDASLWYITEDMVDLLLAATPGVPEETTPMELTLPTESPTGLVLLEKPWIGVSSDENGPLKVDAFMYGYTMLPSSAKTWADARLNPPEDRDTALLALTLSAYQWIDDTDVIARREGHRIPDGKGFFAPLGRSDWPVQTMLGERPWDDLPDDKWESFKEDRRVLATMFTLLTQDGLADVEHRRPDRQAIRRQERAGVPCGPASSVKIITLRRPPSERQEPSGEHRNYSHRFVVRPHWVRQPYGPNQSLRKLIMRGPFVKGPADAPLVLKEEVRVWKR